MQTSFDKIKEKSLELGFDLCGFSKVDLRATDIQNIEDYIKNGHFGSMNWFPKSQNIRISYENLGFKPKFAISQGVMYNTPKYGALNFLDNLKISRYAVGEDYHTVLKKFGNKFLDFLTTSFPGFRFRQGVDTLPISEKSLAKYSGLGWIGKNTNLISKSHGSYFFLSIVLTDMPLPTDPEQIDNCGTCKKCLDACPTGALFEPYKIDSNKCISHATIEDKAQDIDPFIASKLNKWIYGCDICQEVCPFNLKAERNNIFSRHKEFEPLPIYDNGSDYLINLTYQQFDALKKNSAISRVSYKQWKRNVSSLTTN